MKPDSRVAMLDALRLQSAELTEAVRSALETTEPGDVTDRAFADLMTAVNAHAKALLVFRRAHARMLGAVSIGQRRERLARREAESKGR